MQNNNIISSFCRRYKKDKLQLSVSTTLLLKYKTKEPHLIKTKVLKPKKQRS